jgi:hypothetical protein
MKKKLLIFLLAVFMAAGCKNAVVDTLFKGTTIDPNKKIWTTEDYDNIVLEGETVEYTVRKDLPVPADIRASQGNSADSIEVSWKKITKSQLKVDDVDIEDLKFGIYRSSDGSNFDKVDDIIIKSGYDVFYIDDSAVGNRIERGTEYLYIVRTEYVTENETYAGLFSQPVTGYTLGNVEEKDASASYFEFNEYIDVSWAPVLGARYYEILRTPIVPGESKNFTLIKKITGTSYVDKIYSEGGSLQNGQKYAYKIIACVDDSIKQNEPTWEILGATVSASAPKPPSSIKVLSGVAGDRIILEWSYEKGVNYYVFREESSSGKFTAAINEFEDVVLKNDESGNPLKWVYVDSSENLEPYKFYYYKIAGFKEGEQGNQSGSFFGGVLNPPMNVTVTSDFVINHKSVKWDPANGADGYRVRRSGPYNGLDNYTNIAEVKIDPVLYSSIDDAFSWVAEAEVVEENIAVLSGTSIVDNISDEFIGIPPYYYEIFSINEKYYSGITEDSGAGLIIFTDGETVEKFQYVDNQGTGAVMSADDVFSSSRGLSAPNTKQNFIYNKLPAEVLPDFTASNNDSNHKGQVKISITPKAAYDDYLEYRVVKKCGYGPENGIEPQKEPKGLPSSDDFYIKYGEDFIENSYNLDVDKGSASGSQYVVIDPMYNFNEAGNVVEPIEWNYSDWDMEAWKYIKRRKPFDLEEAVSSTYVIETFVKGFDNGETSATSSKKGIPALTDLSLLYLLNWTREVAFNRIWHLQTFEYGYENGFSMDCLTSGGQNKSGDYNEHMNDGGFIKYKANVAKFQGEGHCENYKDWPGFNFTVSDNNGNPAMLTVPVKLSHVPVGINVTMKITVPVYGTYLLQFINVTADQAIFQRGVTAGSNKVYQQSGSSFNLLFEKSYEFYNQYKWKYTKINFIYHPYLPENQNWTNYAIDWTCRYKYIW